MNLNPILKLCLIIWMSIFASSMHAQTTTIKGLVLDARTQEVLSAATISFKGIGIGTTTNIDGQFELTSKLASDTIIVSHLGYDDYIQTITIGEVQILQINLTESVLELETAIVKIQKEKYRNKNNPAVELIKRVINQKTQNNPANLDYLEYEAYEKVLLGVSGISDQLKNRKALQEVQFLFDNLDSISIKGQTILPIYMQEAITNSFIRKQSKANKKLIIADTMVTFKGYVDNKGVQQYLNKMYQDVKIYEDNIVLLDQQFLSPIAKNAPTFYKYFIQDTLIHDGIPCIKMFVAPKNKLDVLFQGTLYIAYLDHHQIKAFDLSLNSNTGLNWVKHLSIQQSFAKVDTNALVLSKASLSTDFGVLDNGVSLYGKRAISYQKIKINTPRVDTDYKGPRVERITSGTPPSDEFWLIHRHTPLNQSEASTYHNLDSLQKVKTVKKLLQFTYILASGFIPTGNKFEVGPFNTFYFWNPLEGDRVRIGGRTTPLFGERTFMKNYLAYGFGDKRFKGFGEVSQALRGGNVFKFPIRRLTATFQHETTVPGQIMDYVMEANPLLAFKRGVNDQFMYNTRSSIEYYKESRNNFTYRLGVRYWRIAPAGSLAFTRQIGDDLFTNVADITRSEVNLTLRYAPKEAFYQANTYRIPIFNKHPIITFRYDLGLKNVLGSDYQYQKFSLHLFKRCYLSRLGFSDVVLSGAMVIGKVPYPLMTTHTANQSFAFSLQAYNLMNYLEFVSDRHVGLHLDHDFNGFFLNRIPLIKRLKWRSAFNAKALYGGISESNLPHQNNEWINFPINSDGEVSTFSLARIPYVEASVGISNIFKVLRIDYVRRFTYLNHPDVTSWGIRGRIRLYF